MVSIPEYFTFKGLEWRLHVGGRGRGCSCFKPNEDSGRHYGLLLPLSVYSAARVTDECMGVYGSIGPQWQLMLVRAPLRTLHRGEHAS